MRDLGKQITVNGFDANPAILFRNKGYEAVIEGYAAEAEAYDGKFVDAIVNNKEAVIEATLAPLTNMLMDPNLDIDTKAQVERDVAYLETALDNAADNIIEAAGTGGVTDYTTLQLPFLYLQTVASNGTKVVANKAADALVCKRSIHKRYVEINGQKEFFPDVLKDSAKLASLKGQTMKSATIEVSANDEDVNLIPLITGAIAGDSIIPSAQVVGVKLFGETTWKAIDTDQILVANATTRGMFGGAVIHGGASVGTVYGQFDFDGAKLLGFQCDTSKIIEVQIKVSASAQSGRHVITPKSEKVDHIVTMSEEINLAHVVTKQWLKDKKMIENTSGTMEVLACFQEVSSAIKDKDIFNHIQEKANAVNPLFSSETFHMLPATGYSGHLEDHKKKAMERNVLNLATKLNKSLNVPAIYKIFGDREQTNEIFGTGLKYDGGYGGVTLDYSIRAVDAGDFRCNVISTERSANAGLTMLPIPLAEHEETTTFYSYDSEISYDRKHPDNNLLPTVSLVERYAVDSVFPAVGLITFSNTQA